MVSRLRLKGSVTYRVPNAMTPSKSTTTIGAKTTATGRVAGHPTSHPVNGPDTPFHSEECCVEFQTCTDFSQDQRRSVTATPFLCSPVTPLRHFEIPSGLSSGFCTDLGSGFCCPVTPLRHYEIPSDLSSGFCTPTYAGVSSEESHVYRKRLRRPLPSFSHLEARYERLRQQRAREEARSRTWTPAKFNMKLRVRRYVYVSYWCSFHPDCFVASIDAELHEEEAQAEVETVMLYATVVEANAEIRVKSCNGTQPLDPWRAF